MAVVIARRAASIHRKWADEYAQRPPVSQPDYTGVYVSQAIGLTVVSLMILGVGYWTLHGVKVLVAPRVVIAEKVAELTGRR